MFKEHEKIDKYDEEKVQPTKTKQMHFKPRQYGNFNYTRSDWTRKINNKKFTGKTVKNSTTGCGRFAGLDQSVVASLKGLTPDEVDEALFLASLDESKRFAGLDEAMITSIKGLNPFEAETHYLDALEARKHDTDVTHHVATSSRVIAAKVVSKNLGNTLLIPNFICISFIITISIL